MLTVTDSISGSGKTTIAVAVAKLLHEQQRKDLYYFFAPVQEDAFGFTPGDLEDKENKYLIPLRDALRKVKSDPDKEIYSTKETKPRAWVHATSHVFWRGGNIENAVVFIDEAQNWTEHELRKVLTRCHDNCHVIISGHQKQCDIEQSKSGFPKYKAEAEKADFASVLQLTKDFRGRLARWADNV